jgi:hypothetical protein
VFNFTQRPNVENNGFDAGQRWAAHIEHTIQKNQHKDIQAVALKLTIVSILMATFELNVTYLDTIVSHMDKENGVPSVHISV